jgi:hypothetical protein
MLDNTFELENRSKMFIMHAASIKKYHQVLPKSNINFILCRLCIYITIYNLYIQLFSLFRFIPTTATTKINIYFI